MRGPFAYLFNHILALLAEYLMPKGNVIKVFLFIINMRTKEEVSIYLKNWKKANKNKVKQYELNAINKDPEEYKRKRREANIKYKKNNPEKVKAQRAKTKLKNKDKIKIQGKLYRDRIKDRLIESRRRYKQDNKDKIKEKSKEYYIKNRDKILKQTTEYLKNNPEKNKIWKNRVWKKRLANDHANINKKKRDNYKKYKENNSDKINERARRYAEIKRVSDPMFKLRNNLRKRTWDAFKRKSYIKGGTTEILLGASFVLVKEHIESKFEDWMNWGNYGKWEIDHKIPLSSAKNEEELRLLCHYTNLQPLLRFYNTSKGAKLDYIIPASESVGSQTQIQQSIDPLSQT